MHINMKYYIVTIAAIFIAIGIGILVGFNLNYDEELSKQQTLIIDDLDVKFEQLKGTNDELKEGLDSLNEEYDKSIEFISQNTDKIIKDTLVDRKIGIISTNKSTSYTEEINNTLINAGATISFDISVKDVLLTDEKLEEISDYLEEPIANSDELIGYIVELLNLEYGKDKLNYFKDLGVLDIENIEDDYYKYDSVVILGGNNNEDEELTLYDSIDRPLIEKLKESNKYIIGVEKTQTKHSYIEAFRENSIATVDNVDESIGRLSLVLKLQSKEDSGSYGRLESADSLIPYKKQ